MSGLNLSVIFLYAYLIGLSMAYLTCGRYVTLWVNNIKSSKRILCGLSTNKFYCHAINHSNPFNCKSIKSSDDLEILGSKLSDILEIGDVLLLKGDLGAGKTTFSRGIIRRKFMDSSMRVTSPSYLLDNVYEFDKEAYIHHIDLYRLPSNCDLSMLGIPSIYRTSICLIEWPQRISETFKPTNYLDIEIKILNDDSREIIITPVGTRWNTIRHQLNSVFS